ncbi:hypothetical protein RQP46_005669 [Phenoliferia psychrophenolica]
MPAFSNELVGDSLTGLAPQSGMAQDVVNRTAVLAEPLRGVNIGGWLVAEAWMYPSRWIAMGGEYVHNQCSNHTMAEWELNVKLNDQEKTNLIFHDHWDSWFGQPEVDRLVALHITSVRIPLGFWLVDALVNRTSEHYAQGGMDMLISRLEMLKKAGIAVLLDHHAVPGVAAENQMFAGRCTDDVEFYTPANYRRAITWSTVLTFLTHAHPSFSTVFAIEAVNEPIQDASLTPGLGDYSASFVLALRIVEASFGIVCDPTVFSSPYLSTPYLQEGLDAAIPIIVQYSMSLYLAFGYVAPEATPTSYLETICNTSRLDAAALVGNTPLLFGEWSLGTEWNISTDQFLRDFGDAQKRTFSRGAGWFFWSMKLEPDADSLGDWRGWSYFDAVAAGLFTADPKALFNESVCDQYM